MTVSRSVGFANLITAGVIESTQEMTKADRATEKAYRRQQTKVLQKKRESFPIFSARRGEAISVLPCLVAAAAENALKASWKFGFDVAESGGARRGKRRRTQMLI